MQRRTGGRGLGAVLFTDIVGSTTIAAEIATNPFLLELIEDDQVPNSPVTRGL